MLDPHRKDRLALADRALDFALDELRFVGRLREDQNHTAGVFDAVNDLVAIFAAGAHVARRDPAWKSAALEAVADRVRLDAIRGGVADKCRKRWFFGRHSPTLLLFRDYAKRRTICQIIAE